MGRFGHRGEMREIRDAYLGMLSIVNESNLGYASEDDDIAYMDAVESGDMEAAMDMVRKAASRAFRGTVVVNEDDGLPKVVYHGTSSYGFTEFRPSTSLRDVGIHFGSKYLADMVSTNRYTRKRSDVSSGVYQCFLNIKNIALVEDEFQMSNKEFADMFSGQNGYDAFKAKTAAGRELQCKIEDKYRYWLENDEDSTEPDFELKGLVMELLKVEGIDGLYYFNKNEADEYDYVALKPSQVKSAEPVTYDDYGNVVPLSSRFDDGDDIRGDVKRS